MEFGLLQRVPIVESFDNKELGQKIMQITDSSDDREFDLGLDDEIFWIIREFR